VTGEMTAPNMTSISATDETMFTFTDLILFSDYQLNVMAYTRMGPGPVANLLVKTLPGGEPHKTPHYSCNS